MRWIYLNIFLLAGLLTASGSSTTRSKRDINLLKNFFHSIIPGTSKVPNFSNTFQLRGHDNIRIRVVPRLQPKVQLVQLNKSEEAGILPPPPSIPPIIDQVTSYLGTNTAEDTLKALDGMKNLLQSGILDAKKEEITNNQIDTTKHATADILSLFSAQDLKKGDEIVFIEDMIKPVNKVVYKPATLLFEHGVLVHKPKIQAVEVLPPKYAPASQYYYHQINNGGTTTYVETRPGGVMPTPPTLDNVQLPTITSDYLMLPPPANRNPFGLGIEIQESSKVFEESSSNMTRHPIPEPQMLPFLQTESDVYVTDAISSSQINRRPLMAIPEPPSLTEVMVVPPGLSYEETIEFEKKPVKVLNVEKYPNRFTYSYVGKNGQTIIYRGSKYNFSVSEPVYEHVFPMSLYPIADYHSVKEISIEDFAGSVPIRQPYAFSYGIGMPTKISSQISSIYAAENDKDSKVEDIVMVPGPAPFRQPYAFSYGIAVPPTTVAAEANKQGYDFSYDVGMPPMMPPPNAPLYATEVEKEGVVAMSGPPPIRQPYAFSYGIGFPPMLLHPSAPGYAAEVDKHESEHEDIVMVPGPTPIRQPYSFGYSIGMQPMLAPPVAAAVAAETDKQESENEKILMVPGPAPIRQPYAFSYGVGMPPIMPLPGAPMPPMYATEVEIEDTEKEDVSIPGPTPIRQPYAFSYGVGMPPMMPPPVVAAVAAETDKQESENEEILMVPGPAPIRQPYAFSYGVGMAPIMPPPGAPMPPMYATEVEIEDTDKEDVSIPGPTPIRQPYAFSYGVGMPPMMPTPVVAAVAAETDKQESENEEILMVPGPVSIKQPYAFSYGVGMPPIVPPPGAPTPPMYATEVEIEDTEKEDVSIPGPTPIRQPYAFGYGVGMPPMMAPPVAAAVDVEADKNESEHEEVIMVPGPAPVRQPYAFGYGVGMPSVLPPPGASMPPMHVAQQDDVVPGPTPMRHPFAFGYGVGMPPIVAAANKANKSGNKEIVMVSHTAPTKHSYAFSYGGAMSAPAYAPYATHYVPHPVPYMLPAPLGQHHVNKNEQMYNSRLMQLCSSCGELPPHILTRVQRLTNNIPSGQVYGINPYAAYQPEYMTDLSRKVPYVNNVQAYEPEFPEKDMNDDVNTNEDAAAEAPNAADSQELEPAENGQEESMTDSAQSSLDKMPIIVGDPVYEYKQMNSDGSSTHVLGHSNDHVSIDLETTEESASSPYLEETVY